MEGDQLQMAVEGKTELLMMTLHFQAPMTAHRCWMRSVWLKDLHERSRGG